MYFISATYEKGIRDRPVCPVFGFGEQRYQHQHNITIPHDERTKSAHLRMGDSKDTVHANTHMSLVQEHSLILTLSANHGASF